MRLTGPVPDLDTRFSSEGAVVTEWADAQRLLEDAQIFWISTVRPDGRPHVTPLIAVSLDEALYFSTGPTEQKAKNLAQNPHCILTTGCNAIDEGLDVVVEGDAVQVTDDFKLRLIADLYESKYGSDWRYEVREGAFAYGSGEGIAFVYEVQPRKAFGFRKGDEFSQTRWRFENGENTP